MTYLASMGTLEKVGVGSKRKRQGMYFADEI